MRYNILTYPGAIKFFGILEFIKKKGIEYSNEIITSNCPNCGAPLDIHSNGECEHCKKIVTRGEYSWTLNKLCYWDERFL